MIQDADLLRIYFIEQFSQNCTNRKLPGIHSVTSGD